MLVKALFMRSGFAVFRYRDYRFFWLAAAFANIGMWSLTLGRLWLMHELTHSPLMVGLVTTSSLRGCFKIIESIVSITYESC